MNARRPCPDSALLAAFIDGTLQDYERTAVVTHLSECGECRAVAATVVEFAQLTALDELWHPPAPRPVAVNFSRTRARQWATEKTRAPALVVATAATIAAILIPALLIYPAWSSRRAVSTLVDAAATERPIDARLSGGFDYAPRGPHYSRQDPSSGHWQLVAAAGRVRDTFHDDPTVGSRQAVGVAALLVGQLDDAVTNLSLAAGASPENGDVLNDLAAAYYERATMGDRPDDLPRALSAVQRALTISPASRDAWFNRALIITALGLREEARAAWQTYLHKDAESSWAQEARTRLERLAPPSTAAADWAALRMRLDRDPDRAAAETAVGRHTSRTRDYLERELLKAWATGVDDAQRSAALDQMRVLGDAFLRLTGDRVYVDIVATIERVYLRGNSIEINSLMAGHRDYLDGAALMAGARFADAAPVLVRAESSLSLFRTPLALRARIELAATDYYGARYDKARSALLTIKTEALASNYTILFTRAAWLLGMAAFSDTDYDQAQVAYEEMLDSAKKAGDLDQRAQANGLLANLHWVLGDAAAAWRHRVDAHAMLGEVWSPTVISVVLLGAAGDALASGDYAASLTFETTLLASPHMIAVPALQARAQRARTLHYLGRATEARAELDQLRTGLAGIADEAVRTRLETDVLTSEAEVLLGVDSHRAARAAQRALTFPNVQRDAHRTSRLNLSLAEASIDIGDIAAAETAIVNGIDALESFQSQPMAAFRLGVSDASWSLYVRGIELALRRGDTARAFDYSERRRVRTRVERRAWGSRVLTLAEVQKGLNPESAVVVLNQLRHELQVWVIRRDDVLTHSVPMTVSRAAGLVANHLHEMTRATATPQMSGQLFNALLRPSTRALEGIGHIVFIPDAPYDRIAFAGLWDRVRNRYLVENHSLASAPSATAFTWLMSRRSQNAAAPQRAVFYDTGREANASRALSAGVRARDTKLAAFYRSGHVRQGLAATPGRLFSDVGEGDVLHITAPAIVNGEFPVFSRLLLTDEPLRKYSGSVSARGLADAGLSQARLIALETSNLESSTLQVEGPGGFARGFLAAGVPSVVASVAEAQGSGLGQTWLDFHRYYASGAAAADSLRRAQLTALRESNHRPGPWAMVTVFGSNQ